MVSSNKRRFNVLTWHVHGNYLYYLTQANCEFYIPSSSPRRAGYYGLTRHFPWGTNVHEVPADEVKYLDIDCIIFQSNFSPSNPTHNYLEEQIEILSNKQLQKVPKLFIEHDPPRLHPTDTRHLLHNVSSITLVHVTHFNQLMWDSGWTKTVVIEHGVKILDTVHYSGEISKGVVVVNNLFQRGRRLGWDVFEQVRKDIPLDLIGMGSKEVGGSGEVVPMELAKTIACYRFFFHPARYTSLGLSVIEAMMSGMPIVGLATTELPTVITNNKNGYLHTRIETLIDNMKTLLTDKMLANRMGVKAKQTALRRFSIHRFVADWERLITQSVVESGRTQALQQKEVFGFT